jgi:ABC-type dipeptide/oligopeptide/nickel transport system permease component
MDGSRFDTWTSGVIIIGYAIPGFLFAILLIILFAGGSFLRSVSVARADVGQLGTALLVAEDPRLFLASDIADHLDDARRLRDHDLADEKFVPR